MLSDSCRIARMSVAKEKPVHCVRFASGGRGQIVLLSEVFALSLERIETGEDRALIEERSNDSANTSLSGAFETCAGAQARSRSSLQHRSRWSGAKARGAARPPNKRLQRTVERTVSFLQRWRAAAEPQR